MAEGMVSAQRLTAAAATTGTASTTVWPEIYLGLPNISADESEDLAAGRGWQRTASKLDGIWLNMAGFNQSYLPGVVAQTKAKKVISVLNIGTTNRTARTLSISGGQYSAPLMQLRRAKINYTHMGTPHF